MTAFPLYNAFENVPGIGAALETVENQFIDQNYSHLVEIPVVVAGSARDAGNTGYTSTLRAGLALGGPIDAGATDAYKVKEWDPTDTDGSNFFFGFLKYPLKVVDATGANQDKYTVAVVEGAVLSDRIIVPGNVATGLSGTYYEELLQQAYPRFIFDKHVNKRALYNAPLPLLTLSVFETSSGVNTLTAAQSDRTYTNTGDSGSRTVNLPTPVPGLKYRFVRIAAQNIVLDSGSNTFVSPGNVTANTLTVASAGAYVEVTGISTTQYLVTAAAGTITPA